MRTHHALQPRTPEQASYSIGRRDGKHFVYSHEQIMQKYQQNMRMVDRMPDALSGAMGNQMYVATFSTREGMEQFYSDRRS